MPELPEVESTIKRLQEQLPNKKVTDAYIGWKNMLPLSTPKEFIAQIRGCTFRAPYRRGKYLVFPLKKNRRELHLILHQKMSGRTKIFSQGEERSPYDHVVVVLHNNAELRMTDPRKFGRAYIVEDPDTVLSHLGPEPLDPAFTYQDFVSLLQKRKGAMKPLLLAQDFIAGLGNIYVDETLWAAKVHPLRSASTLTEKEQRALYKHMRLILQAAIDAHGTDFGDGVIYGGDYEPKVYGRSGKKCKRCKNVIERILVGARGTHICTTCQRE